MPISQLSLQRGPGAGVLNPLNLAAYATCAGVSYGPLRQTFFEATPVPHAWVGVVALLGLQGLFILRAVLQARGASVAAQRACVIPQAIAALISCWVFRDGLQPTLLVLVAVQIAGLFPTRAALAILAAINVVLGWLLIQYGITAEMAHMPAQLLAAYLGFQAFALLTCHALVQEMEARNTAQQINAELIATRKLLGEGARAEERLRLSRELHDIAGHKLTALKMQLGLLRRKVAAEHAAAVAESEKLAGDLLTDIRGVVSTLRQHEGVDLQKALVALDPGLPRPRVTFELDPEVRVADMRRADALLHCAQEGLTNALRHSGASVVRVALARSPQGVTLTVEDDGAGSARQVRVGNGLRGLRERMEEVGGRLSIGDHAPSGLQLQALVPDPAPA
ncbi:MAG TPA: histidine kinase [Nevskiaceae bacterium]|nr:histidine kinase [Nevskiaceae bacterium]